MRPNIQYLEALIAEGKTDDALDALLQDFQDGEHRKEIILLKSQLAEHQSHFRIGIIRYDDFQFGLNKINHALLRFLQSVEKGVPAKMEALDLPSPFSEDDPFSFHKKMLPIIVQKLRKSELFYQQCMFGVLLLGLGVLLAGLYFNNSFFNIGGGTLWGLSGPSLYTKYKVSQKLIVVQGLLQTISTAPPKGREAEEISSTLLLIVKKYLNL